MVAAKAHGKSQMAVRRSFGARPVCGPWETSPTLGTDNWEERAEPQTGL